MPGPPQGSGAGLWLLFRQLVPAGCGTVWSPTFKQEDLSVAQQLGLTGLTQTCNPVGGWGRHRHGARLQCRNTLGLLRRIQAYRRISWWYLRVSPQKIPVTLQTARLCPLSLYCTVWGPRPSQVTLHHSDLFCCAAMTFSTEAWPFQIKIKLNGMKDKIMFDAFITSLSRCPKKSLLLKQRQSVAYLSSEIKMLSVVCELIIRGYSEISFFLLTQTNSVLPLFG